MDVSGRIIFQTEIKNDRRLNQFSLQKLPKGVYTLISKSENEFFFNKIVIQ
ncbi:MAG: T9SS type A sorting domain-containing protein [Chitinophagaceae bacterium]|nr:T9SS type A sorting domain-containing protein [Chitinophagaceae bacterium]